MSTRFRSSHAPINSCRKATNICLTRRSPLYGPRQITATAAVIWRRSSPFGRMERVVSPYMVPLRKMNVTRRNNGQDVRCVDSFILCHHLEVFTMDFLQRGIYHISCRLIQNGCRYIVPVYAQFISFCRVTPVLCSTACENSTWQGCGPCVSLQSHTVYSTCECRGREMLLSRVWARQFPTLSQNPHAVYLRLQRTCVQKCVRAADSARSVRRTRRSRVQCDACAVMA